MSNDGSFGRLIYLALNLKLVVFTCSPLLNNLKERENTA
jgi:hypothetical protein